MSSSKHEHMNRILAELKDGSTLTKRKHSGEKYSRHFFLDEHESFISYYQSEKVFAQSRRYYISKIDEIRAGFHTRTFDRLLRRELVDRADEQVAFSIFYNNYRDELHLMANNERTRNLWIQGLQYLIDLHAKERQQHLLSETNLILSYFRLADKDGSGSLTKRECRRLLTDLLNVNIPEADFEMIFKDADKSGEGVLSPDEFIDFFHTLTRRTDLFEIMQKYVINSCDKTMETIRMNKTELLYFLQAVQNQSIVIYSSDESNDDFIVEPVATTDQVQELINQFEPSVQLQEEGLLSLNGFRNLLLSEEFSLMKPWCSRRIYQDMTRPLNHYFINSSHNTYLFDNQLTGNSNPEAYNRALRSGCRVVEMDCYDGDNGYPVVTHGYTLVKPCSFESIIRFIEPNLFKASPYPVILSIENHCSNVQSQKMGEILKRILGDRLVIPPAEGQSSPIFPSPENLKYKVVVRSTKAPSFSTISKLVEFRARNEGNKMMHKTNEPVAAELSDDFVFFESSVFRASDDNNHHDCSYRSPSLSERELKQASQSDPVGIMRQAQKYLLRMYPDALRQDSSNPNPIDGWNVGIPIVALNYQTDDRMMELCHGKFLDNGGCGYVLKPDYLIDVEVSKFNPMKYAKEPPKSHKRANDCPQRLTITVISGQFINRSSEKTSDVPDPYVLISTHGVGCDQKEVKTKFINNNGLNPTWNETFSFDIYFPEMCLVRFEVFDYDTLTHDDRVAYFCLPMTTMQTGFRHIQLRAKNNNPTYSTLFIYVSVDEKNE